MTFPELIQMIQDADWFQHLGEPDIDDRFVRIQDLSPWENSATGNVENDRIADEMEWLPSSRDQGDPIYGRELEQCAESAGIREECSRRGLEAYKETLFALRKFGGHPALKVGPHDFTGAARGAALFAARRATYETLLCKPDFWCQMMIVYHNGHWPCGTLRSGKVVVL